MRSAQIAEWILALFLEPDRAAAYTGDLMEEAAEHHAVWFWSSVIRLAIMRFWYDAAESPFYLAGVLLRASILNVALTIFMVVGSGILLIPVFLILVGALRLLSVPVSGLDEPARWVGLALGIGVIFLGAFYTGRWIAAKMPRREMVVCISMCVAQPVLYSLVGFTIMHFWGAGVEHYFLTHTKANQTAYPTPPDPLIWLMTYAGFIAGGLRLRLRSVTQ